jgi:hypothetical protein
VGRLLNPPTGMEQVLHRCSCVQFWGTPYCMHGMVQYVHCTMTAFRKQCLSLPHGSHITVQSIQQVVEEDVELTRVGC